MTQDKGKVWVSEICRYVDFEVFQSALARGDVEMPDTLITTFSMTRTQARKIWPELLPKGDDDDKADG